MRLNQITVPSLDVLESIAFYKKLGLELVVHTHDQYARFLCTDGEATFSIHEVEQLPTGNGIVVYFECDELDERVESLILQGLKFEELPNDKSWLWRESFLFDPSGNKIILYYAGENRVDPPWRKK